LFICIPGSWPFINNQIFLSSAYCQIAIFAP
jgi:hypothetical protein